MNAAISAVLVKLETMLGGLCTAAFGAVDLFHFGKLAQSTDMVFVTLGLSIVTGVNIARALGTNNTPQA